MDLSNLDRVTGNVLLPPNMGLGTKHRLAQNVALCRQHLRTAHADKLALVSEFVSEIQGSEGDSQWNQFTDAKRSGLTPCESLLKKTSCRMLGLSLHSKFRSFRVPAGFLY